MAEEKVKCTNCKGTGVVPNNQYGKRYKTCPICKGTGKKNLHKSNQTKSK